MNTYKEQLDRYIDEHVDDMLRDTMALIRIDSVKGESNPGMPFGEKSARVLDFAYDMLSGYGFICRNHEHYVITADMNEQDTNLDILAHLDVVPADTEWTVTEPFVPLIQDGRLYGRGSSDDKGPAVAALYAMRAVRELGIPLKKNVRLILGSDEETGSDDIAYYYKHNQAAPMTVSPDADFPLVNIEKGILHGEFSGSYPPADSACGIVSLHSGTGINVVPEMAEVMLSGSVESCRLQELCAKAAESTGVKFTITEENNGTQITARGNSCHAAMPETGNNALTAMLELLADENFSSYAGYAALLTLHQLFPHGDWSGKKLGIAMSDELSGSVNISLTKLDLEGGQFAAGFDCRAPLCATNENLRDVVKEKLASCGMSMRHRDIYAPHYVPEESAFVQTLLDCYEMYSGKRGKPLAIGGGSYVHAIENGVAFGCADPQVDNHMHGADEFAVINQLVMSAKIYAQTIVRLCG